MAGERTGLGRPARPANQRSRPGPYLGGGQAGVLRRFRSSRLRRVPSDAGNTDEGWPVLSDLDLEDYVTDTAIPAPPNRSPEKL